MNAEGQGRDITYAFADVNQLLKQFQQMQKMMKMMKGGGAKKMMRQMEAMRGKGILTRGDLAIGCLVVEGVSVVVTHEEHDGIRLPPGNYYVGRQVESAGAEERVVAD